MPHLQDHCLSNPGGMGRGPEAGVGKDTYVGIIYMSISGDVSTGAALFLHASSRVYAAARCRISQEDIGVTLKCLGGRALHTPHGHLLLNEESHVRASPRDNRAKASRLMVVEDTLILGKYDGVVDKAKPEPSNNIQVLLLKGHPCLDPPRGGIQNQWCKPSL
ncbi:hypothetical protein H5410_056347 [Solanum commersonii]|uniref:Uncharacterized protein n=1 Tax=Solanum commersonii TaxID=4109 RepID=A0A9J5WLG4_SOLCO|nr:hypothetical protein H5410_056347 [Solanum commersonii]